MVVVVNRLQCPGSYSVHLEQACKQAGNLEGVPGFLSFTFLRHRTLPAADEVEYLALTTWESNEAYEAWRQSESFARAPRAAAGASPITSTLAVYDALP
jgi:heme-degrading monooxygenase HmoA